MSSSHTDSATAPVITYPEQLPVSQRREEIMTAVRDHQVVIVAGETGSGKTTQLPKMCLELGLAEHGVIGHTQPRRIAARSVSERIAEEMGEEIGSTVGYQVRFTTQTSRDTQLKVMTDGILLAEIPHDPLLRRYSVIIIDEAHERSLNIDFLLGYLRRLLPQRPDLKIIITSATIDPESFAQHFGADPDHTTEPEPAPVIEVSGRTYPVEIRYRPLSQPATRQESETTDDADGNEEDRDPVDAVADAVDELSVEPPGDILVFFPGEREIRDAAEALGPRVAANPRLTNTEILPLYGRLSMAEQHRVFRTGANRRIVLATNVAETSLTVPGIKYVIDTGTARISRYSHRTKVQRLPIERISQASANQRSGRSGRTSPGIAVRLYSEEDFEARSEFTDPEILRTNLAAVVLQMLHLGVARTPTEVTDFPFLQPPDSRQVNDGSAVLTELGALNTGQPDPQAKGRTFPKGTITPLGRKLARLPVDPRLGRMILAASELGCVREVMVLTAALTIQDPRERPAEQRGQADEMHARFSDDVSDFSALLNLWSYLRTQQKELSGNQFRKRCRAEFINYLRVREWQDLVQQLRQLASQIGVKVSAGPVDPVAMHEPVHRSLLAGLLSHIGSWDERQREYAGARGTRFAVFPGSSLFKKRHGFVVAAELVETSRLWARTVAKVEPGWIEDVAGSLAKHTYSEPHWSRRQGTAMARERVTVLGVTIAVDRPVRYYHVDRAEARALFIQHALVEGDWHTRHHFFARNRTALAEVEELETRLRRRDLRVSDDDLFRFYDERIPANVVSERHFDSWWKKERRRRPELLDFDTRALLQSRPEDLDTDRYPTVFQHPTSSGVVELPLEYEFNPVSAPAEAETDGITVTIPVVLLNQMEPARFAWLIPGLRTELVTALIRSLDKPVRKNFVPAPDVARQAVTVLDAEFDPSTDDLFTSLETVLRRLKGFIIPEASWHPEKLPEHLTMAYRIVDERGAVVGAGEDLTALQSRLSGANQTAIAQSLAEAGISPETTSSARTDADPMNRKNRKSTETNQRQKTAPPDSAGSVSPTPPPSTAQSGFTPRHGITTWDVADIPASVQTRVSTGSGTQQITGYPALRAETLADGAAAAGLIITRTTGEQLQIHRGGVTALLQCQMPNPQRYVLDHLDHREKLTFSQSPHGKIESLVTDCTAAAIDALLPGQNAELPFTQQGFNTLFQRVRAELIDTVFAVTRVAEQTLRLAGQVRKRIKSTRSLAMAATVSDLSSQLDKLIYPGFIAATGWHHLQHLPRYLQAMLTRLDKLEAGGQLQRDGLQMQTVQNLEDAYDQALRAVPDSAPVPQQLAEIRWLLEELRVSLFTQDLGTAVTVSEKRLRQALQRAQETG